MIDLLAFHISTFIAFANTTRKRENRKREEKGNRSMGKKGGNILLEKASFWRVYIITTFHQNLFLIQLKHYNLELLDSRQNFFLFFFAQIKQFRRCWQKQQKKKKISFSFTRTPFCPKILSRSFLTLRIEHGLKH